MEDGERDGPPTIGEQIDFDPSQRWLDYTPGNDPYSQKSEKKAKYWECECGLKRTTVETIFKHCKDDGHKAKLIDSENEDETLATLDVK